MLSGSLLLALSACGDGNPIDLDNAQVSVATPPTLTATAIDPSQFEALMGVYQECAINLLSG